MKIEDPIYNILFNLDYAGYLGYNVLTVTFANISVKKGVRNET